MSLPVATPPGRRAHAIAGPRDDYLADPSALTATTWTASSRSDRVGMRLEGGRLERLGNPGAAQRGRRPRSDPGPPGRRTRGCSWPTTRSPAATRWRVVDADVDRAAQVRPGRRSGSYCSIRPGRPRSGTGCPCSAPSRRHPRVNPFWASAKAARPQPRPGAASAPPRSSSSPLSITSSGLPALDRQERELRLGKRHPDSAPRRCAELACAVGRSQSGSACASSGSRPISEIRRPAVPPGGSVWEPIATTPTGRCVHPQPASTRTQASSTSFRTGNQGVRLLRAPDQSRSRVPHPMSDSRPMTRPGSATRQP